jgi:hypothetical protein
MITTSICITVIVCVFLIADEFGKHSQRKYQNFTETERFKELERKVNDLTLKKIF